MSDNKTAPGKTTVAEFLGGISDTSKRKDCKVLAGFMRQATGQRAKMWGTSIVGFGQYHYRYESGREGDMCLVGFSPRKQNLAVYIMPGFSAYKDLLARLGKHKSTKSCLYLNRLSDVDTAVLQQLIEASVRDMRKKYPGS